MKLALDRAILAKTHAFTLGPKCRYRREKAAWEDCIKLYDFTVSKIKETMDPNVKCSKTDAQTANELVPNMDKQMNNSDMLDSAVDYIKDLQRQYKILNENRANYKCMNTEKKSI